VSTHIGCTGLLQLVRDVRKSVNSDLSMEWLKPFMTERQCTAGEILFYKDEKAEDMLYIVSGKFKLVESGIVLPVGAIVGENSVCCRRRICEPSRWNAWKPASS